jgi:hypothetical protein
VKVPAPVVDHNERLFALTAGVGHSRRASWGELCRGVVADLVHVAEPTEANKKKQSDQARRGNTYSQNRPQYATRPSFLILVGEFLLDALPRARPEVPAVIASAALQLLGLLQ